MLAVGGGDLVGGRGHRPGRRRRAAVGSEPTASASAPATIAVAPNVDSLIMRTHAAKSRDGHARSSKPPH
jgi:hypothetical protein